VQLLISVLPEADLSPERAIALLNYYVGRNAAAKRAHEKRWEKRHQGVKFKMLL
jgi:hypothetical protein